MDEDKKKRKPRRTRTPEGYMTVTDLMHKVGHNTPHKILKDIKAGRLRISRLPGYGKRTPAYVALPDADIYIAEWLTPQPVS